MPCAPNRARKSNRSSVLLARRDVLSTSRSNLGPLVLPMCLFTRERENLLVAGRCISVDHRVHHSTNEIPACMATGEAAGVAAALASSSGMSVKHVAIEELQGTLRHRGAILGRS